MIYFYLTSECNLACRHCWISPRFRNRDAATEYLNLELFLDIIEQAAPLGLQAVKLTGGEPLIHPQISDILTCLKDSSLGVNVETNGILVTDAIANQIASCKKPFVSVSLDGTDAKTHEWMRGIPGCFKKTCRAIEIFVHAGIRPQVIMTVMRQNVHQVEAMVRLAELLGAGSVKFNFVQPTARGETMHNDGLTLSVKELISLGKLFEDRLAEETNLKLFFYLPPAFQPLHSILGNARSHNCGRCNIRNIIGVLGNGSYALCGIGETIPDMIFGNAGSERLETVWNDNPVINEIRNGIPERLEGICSKCAMKYICQGSCLAQNYYSSGSLWAPFWFCKEAEEKGLFPESRLVP